MECNRTIFLAGLSDMGKFGISEKAAAAIGLLALFTHIGTAIFLFVTNAGRLSKYEYLEREDFETDYGVDGMARTRLEPLSRVYWLLITAVYLAVSFLTMRWDRTWIIWAVSGVFFALVRAIATTIVGDK